jgi:hypothetical protein
MDEPERHARMGGLELFGQAQHVVVPAAVNNL